MAPQVLYKVIHGRPDPEPWQKALLKFKPAVLHGYQRRRVRWAEYPGVIPVSESSSASDSTLETSSARSSSVLGIVVSGLTDGDIYRLDQYEGDEYELLPVKAQLVRVASEKAGYDSPNGHIREVLNAVGADAIEETGEEIDTKAYIYTAGEDKLEDAEWDFASFKKDKMAWWIERNA